MSRYNNMGYQSNNVSNDIVDTLIRNVGAQNKRIAFLTERNVKNEAELAALKEQVASLANQTSSLAKLFKTIAKKVDYLAEAFTNFIGFETPGGDQALEGIQVQLQKPLNIAAPDYIPPPPEFCAN
jgi:hypothetical protein